MGGALACPQTARADATEELKAVQQQIQAGNEAYEEASEHVEELASQIKEYESRIAQIEEELPEQRERVELSVRTLYKMQQASGSLLNLLLSADDFNDLITTIQYLDAVQAHNSEAVEDLAALQSELTWTRGTLESQKDEAEAEKKRAEEALEEANAARKRLEEEIAAQAAAEEAARQEALRVAQEAAAAAAARGEEDTFTTESGSTVVVDVPSSPSPDPDDVDWTSEKDAFVSEWTARIDAYLAGSPLAGQGKTFAEAAWEFGCDPRLSPAISTVESSTGRVCFLPHNAWGWGSSSWDSWEEAIWDHVEGLAIGYGGQLTLAGAHKYCPPNADRWYLSVLAQMEMI